MKLFVQVIKVYAINTEGGDTTDPQSVRAHVGQVEAMQSTEIEATGKLASVSVEHAEVVGPDDEE